MGCNKENKGATDKTYIDIFDNPNISLISPSGNYLAIIKKFNDNGIESYKIYIKYKDNDNDLGYETDLIFRARDKNYIFWADESDILWGYSGDIGTFFWSRENGNWAKHSYADNRDAVVPQALKKVRPRNFQ